MGNLYANACVDSALIYDYVASGCPVLSADGLQAIACVPTSTGVTVSVTELATSTTTSYTHTPALITCNKVEIDDAITLAWLVVAVWVVAWAIKAVAETIRSKA